MFGIPTNRFIHLMNKKDAFQHNILASQIADTKK